MARVRCPFLFVLCCVELCCALKDKRTSTVGIVKTGHLNKPLHKIRRPYPTIQFLYPQAEKAIIISSHFAIQGSHLIRAILDNYS